MQEGGSVPFRSATESVTIDHGDPTASIILALAFG